MVVVRNTRSDVENHPDDADGIVRNDVSWGVRNADAGFIDKVDSYESVTRCNARVEIAKPKCPPNAWYAVLRRAVKCIPEFVMHFVP